MNKRLIITSPRWYMLLLLSLFTIYGLYLWSVGWVNESYRVMEPANCVVIGILALIFELRIVTVTEKYLIVWWLFIPMRIVPRKKITSITIVQKSEDESDDSIRALITIAPCVYRADMTLTAAEFARQHLLKGIFFRIPKKNPGDTIHKLKKFCPDMEIPFVTQ